MNLHEWIRIYYTVHRRLAYKSSTIDSYINQLRYVPKFWELENVTGQDIQALINDLFSQGLSSSTIKHVLTILRSPIRNAPKYGYFPRQDIFSYIELPKPKKSVIHALGRTELDLIDFSKSCYGDIYLMLVLTGIRVGELIALDCGDVDLINRRIFVKYGYYKGKRTDPKTSDSVRIIPLNSVCFDIVRRNYKLVRTAPLFCGARSGKRLDYRSLLNCWHQLLESAGLQTRGLHVLRHTFATELLRAGVSLKVISTLLGHKSISITADIYTDVPFELCETAVQQLCSAVPAANTARL